MKEGENRKSFFSLSRIAAESETGLREGKNLG
jgi:hypothetical protein